MKKPHFSAKDAQALVRLAELAPQPNLPTAMEAAQVIKRFAEFYNAISAPKAPKASIPE